MLSSMSMSTPAPDSTHSPSIDILSPRAVEQTVSLDATTIWRLRKRGDFPEPIRLSPGRVGYRRADIAAWIASRGGAR
jgi:prophage regulatory protein